MPRSPTAWDLHVRATRAQYGCSFKEALQFASHTYRGQEPRNLSGKFTRMNMNTRDQYTSSFKEAPLSKARRGEACKKIMSTLLKRAHYRSNSNKKENMESKPKLGEDELSYIAKILSNETECTKGKRNLLSKQLLVFFPKAQRQESRKELLKQYDEKCKMQFVSNFKEKFPEFYNESHSFTLSDKRNDITYSLIQENHMDNENYKEAWYDILKYAGKDLTVVKLFKVLTKSDFDFKLKPRFEEVELDETCIAHLLGLCVETRFYIEYDYDRPLYWNENYHGEASYESSEITEIKLSTQ